MAGPVSQGGGSSLHRVMSTTSPGGSDVGSNASGAPTRLAPSLNRLGNLHGAGLSSLHLALNEEGSSSPASGLSGYNAISTLLNNPKRPQRPIDPNSSRYPPISQSHTDLPKVKRSDYEAYISATQKEWERFQRNVKLGSRGKARLEAEDVARGLGDGVEGEGLDESEADHTTAVVGKKKLPALSTVPQVFFAEDFDLGNPYTFDLVTERYKAAGAANNAPSRNGSALSGSGYDVALNQMLQEKLSYYSDVVEQHLILEISARSSSFFAALGNLQDLESEASHCLRKVEKLKSELEEKEEGIAKTGLRVIREQAKRREMVERLEAVGVLQLLCEKKNLCQLLVQNGEWNEALEVMELLGDVVQGKQKLQSASQSSLPPHVDLDFASIGCVQAFVLQLEEMKRAIASQLERDLLEMLSIDLAEQIGEPRDAVVPPPAIDQSMAAMEDAKSGSADPRSPSSEAPVALSVKGKEEVTGIPGSEREVRLQERISAHLHGLIRTQGIDAAMAGYRDVALTATKNTLRLYLCESREMKLDDRRDDLATLLEDDEAASGKADAKLGPGGAEAASKLRELDHQGFVEMTRFLLLGLTKSIRAVEVQTKVILRVLAEVGKSEAEDVTVGLMMPLGVSPSLPTTLATVVSDVCGLAHVLSSRLMSLRSSTHIHLSLQHFLAVFHLCWTFILQSETICSRMIIGLRGVVLNQAKAWLANFHRIRIENAARAVEEETWGQVEVSGEQQNRINLIVQSATSDPASLVISQDQIIHTEQSVDQAATPAGETTMSKTVEVEDRQFFVVGATLDVLEVLLEYVKVVINLPLLSTETMARVVEFSKQFNSRTCQVVLGAGAMRSAGLRNITAKHLALASQSLSIMITLIPYIRETVRRHLSPKQAVMLIEFDKLKRDYQEHQYEIHSKLVAIMSDRLTVHTRALASVAWNAEGGEEVEPVKPVADLVKETTTLHKVLCKYSQSSVVEQVIGQVLIAIDKRLSVEFQKVEVKEEAAWKKMQVCSDYFDEKFGALKSVQWSPKEMGEVIEEHKTALEKSKMAAAEKKEAAPAAYKPRIPLFGRKSFQAASSASVSGRASTESSEAKIEEESLALTHPAAAAADGAGGANGTDAADTAAVVPPSPPAGQEAPLPVKKDKEEEASLEGGEGAPPTPSKDLDTTAAVVSPSSAAGEMAAAEGSDVVVPSPPPSQPATPERVSHDIVTSPTPAARLTLQQRLAEAARRRAQGGSNNSSRPSTANATPAVATSGEGADVSETAAVVDAAEGRGETEKKEAEDGKEEVRAGERSAEEDVAEEKGAEERVAEETNAEDRNAEEKGGEEKGAEVKDMEEGKRENGVKRSGEEDAEGSPEQVAGQDLAEETNGEGSKENGEKTEKTEEGESVQKEGSANAHEAAAGEASEEKEADADVN